MVKRFPRQINTNKDSRGRDRMVVGFTTSSANSA